MTDESVKRVLMPKIIDKKKIKKKIIHSALDVFSNKGYHEAKVSQIAKKVGMGKGTLYEYFKSKGEIFSACIDLIFSDVDKMVMKNINKNDSPSIKLKKVLEGYKKVFFSYPRHYFNVIIEFWNEGIREKNFINLKNIYREFSDKIKEIVLEGIIRGEFNKDINPKTVASTVLAFMDGIMLQWIIESESINLSMRIDGFFDALLRGIQRR